MIPTLPIHAQDPGQITATTAALTDCREVFSDNFNDGNANGWRPQTPSLWDVERISGNFAYCLKTPKSGGTGSEASVLEGNTWTNFTLEVNARASDDDNDKRNFFILFGIAAINDPLRNSYYLHFDAEEGVRLFRTVNTSGVIIDSAPSVVIRDRDFYRIRIERQAPNIRAYFDGRLVIEIDDATFTSGQIGFGSFTSTACFDDVSISVCDQVRTLTVASSNPNSGVNITVSPDDNNGRGSGTTMFTRVYNQNTTVTLTAPATASGNNFRKWQRNGVDYSTNRTATVNMDADYTLTAVYETPLFELVAERIYLRTGPDSGPEVDNPVPGEQYFLHFEWRNDGATAVDFRIELKINNTLGCGYRSGTIPHGPNYTYCTSPITWPTSADPIVIEGALDVTNIIRETNESNNVATKEFPPNQTNLTATALRFSPASINTGGTVNLSGTVTNDGKASTGNAFTVKFYLSTSPSTPNVNLLLHSFRMSALGAGQSRNFNETGTVPTNTTPGSYYVWMSVDAYNDIDESNEDDNQLRAATQLTVTPVSQIGPVAAATQTIGTEFTVDIEVSEVKDLFGVSFVLNYTNTVHLDYVTSTRGEFLGNDVVFLATPDDPAGRVSIGVSRKAGQPGSTGSGVVARVRFTSRNTTPDNTEILFSLSNVLATDVSGNSITLTPFRLTITLRKGNLTVWPGDTNNDGIANQADVLPLGRFWGRTGPARSGGSMNWNGQLVQPWSPPEATYADANGDGIVDQADVLPIGLNWEKTHTFVASTPGKVDYVSNADLLVEIDPAPALNQEFFIRMKLAQATDLFGLTFKLLYDRPDMLQILSVEPDEGFGAEVVFYSKTDPATGKIAAGISRKSGQESVHGSGSAVRIKAKFFAKARLGEIIAFSITEVAANDSQGQPIAMRSQTVKLTIGATTVADAGNAITDYRLYQNSPNPFNPETLIRYEIPQAGPVLLKVYNFTGQEVRVLVNVYQQPGSHQISWDGLDAQGRTLPSGTYLYRLQAGSFVETRKMVLLR